MDVSKKNEILIFFCENVVNLDFGKVHAMQHESTIFFEKNVVVKNRSGGFALAGVKAMKTKKSSSHAAWEGPTRDRGYNNNYTLDIIVSTTTPLPRGRASPSW